MLKDISPNYYITHMKLPICVILSYERVRIHFTHKQPPADVAYLNARSF